MLILVRESEQVIGHQVVANYIVTGAAEEVNRTVYVKVQGLVETLAAYIGAKLSSVVADDLGKVVAPLECIADLRDLTLEVVADGEAAGDADEGQAFAALPQIGSDSEFRVGGKNGWRISVAIEAETGSRSGTGVDQQVGALGMKELTLRVAEPGEASLVDGSRVQRPGMGNVQLLRAGGSDSSKSGQHIGGG